MSFVAISVGTAVASSGYKIFDSARKSSQANKIAENNKRPVYERPEEIDDVYNMALSEVNNTQEQDLLTQELDQNASAGIDAILKSGGRADFGTINNTYGTQLRAALQSVWRQRDARVAAANNASYNLAKAKDAEFQYNKDAPFKDAKQREAQLRQQAEQQKMDGINGLTNVASNLALGNLAPGQYGNPAAAETGLPSRMPVSQIEIPGATPPPQTGRIENVNLNIPGSNPLPQNNGYGDNPPQRNWQIDYFDEFGNPVYK